MTVYAHKPNGKDSQIASYWGKADENYAGSPKWHPLVYHCLDVAACGSVLLECQPTWLSSLERTTGLAADRLRPWLVFLLAIHDLGKFGDGFQGLRLDLWQELQERSGSVPSGERHDTMGYEAGMEYLPEWLARPELSRRGGLLLRPWLAPVTGHHGRPPKNLDNARILLLRNNFPQSVLTDMRSFIEEVRQLLMPDGWPPIEPESDLAERYWRASWLLAGLAVAADWLGSNTLWFPYQKPKLGLPDYWEKVALPQAQHAVAESGLIPSRVAVFPGIGVLFHNISNPTPLQDWAASVPIAEGPQLFVLEELTGSGKTEAALTLAARLMEAGLGRGVYIALPTMATADAMFDRVRDGYGWRRFFDGEGAQLVLAHSASRMKLRLEEANRRDHEYGRGQQEETTASRHCTAWLSDSRKKALLADFGVGTLDQALLAVLPARHQSLRLLGLSTKVLVVDEVHACDAYMGELLARLLHFHAAQGGSAILLSATLPIGQRARYLRAFSDGAGFAPRTPENTAYPLATHIAASSLKEGYVEARRESARTVAVDAIRDHDLVFERLATSMGAGRCAVWVRNTVVDAVEAWSLWNEAHPAQLATLFHARFALVDRLRIGEDIKESFKPESGPNTRRGRLVIATQVIEQSLDIDFDDMVTDLAPIDLIIQRAGRLQRHRRDAEGNRVEGEDGRGGARLCVVMPEPIETADARWLPAHLSKTGKIYDDHGKLWLTARWLAEHQGFSLPEQARDMIESVYAEEAYDRLPEGLRKIADRADGADRADRGTARGNLLDYANGYNPTSLTWQDEGEAPTRLGEATVRVRLAKRTEGGVAPWADTNTGMDWQLSELIIPRRMIAQESEKNAAVIESARAVMADEGRHAVIVVLDGEGDTWRGHAINAWGEGVQVTYSPVTGLATAREEDESDQ